MSGPKPPNPQLDLVEWLGGEPRDEASHIWGLDPNEHYVEEAWVDTRLFQEEPFIGTIHDPCCGFGRIPEAAKAHGLQAIGTDMIDHGYVHMLAPVRGFLTSTTPADNFVMNPPFKQGRLFVEHALTLATRKVAAIVPVRRLPAMGKWLKATPLFRVWFLSPRPSMPPGSYIKAGKKVGGGKQDFCWCVWLQGFDGVPSVQWLNRDGGK